MINEFAPDTQSWVGNKRESRDRSVKQPKGDFLAPVKNIYRVLLSRGIKERYVCFLDKDTERFVRGRLDTDQFAANLRKVAEPTPGYGAPTDFVDSQ